MATPDPDRAPQVIEEADAAGRGAQAAERDYYASQWQLIWRRFRRHRLASGALVVLGLFYLCALLAPFIGPHDPHEKSLAYKEAPPQRLRFVTEEGFRMSPVVYPLTRTMNMETFRTTFAEDRSRGYPVRFFVRGSSYRLLGLFDSDLHLFGTGDPQVPVHLFGTDSLGRDMLSRVLYGAQISLSVGLVGVGISFFLGIFLGGLAGFFGGAVDEVIQRGIEVFISIPQLPLWMGLSAALPTSWSIVRTYFAITIILSLVSWTGLARVVRGKFLSLREEDFIIAARVSGCGDVRTIFVHMLPSFLSHIIAALTLSIPNMILGETALSFLGLGMQAPAISWGVLLQSAQNVHTLALAPWLMIPGLFVIAAVLAFNFLGDGLRDAADPYSR